MHLRSIVDWFTFALSIVEKLSFMYRNNPTLTQIEHEVANEFEQMFGFALSPDIIHYIYGSQSLGALHFVDKLQEVKLRGLLILTPSKGKLEQKGIPYPEQTPVKPTLKSKKIIKTNNLASVLNKIKSKNL